MLMGKGKHWRVTELGRGKKENIGVTELGRGNRNEKRRGEWEQKGDCTAVDGRCNKR